MTTLDLSRPHVVYRDQYAEGRWRGGCTCGAEFFGLSEDSIAEQWEPHRRAERERVGLVADRERDEARRRRREARREQRRTKASKVEPRRRGVG